MVPEVDDALSIPIQGALSTHGQFLPEAELVLKLCLNAITTGESQIRFNSSHLLPHVSSRKVPTS